MRCAVPKCETNKSKRSQKTPLFRVPIDNEMREKCRQSIGIRTLRSSQRVCAKHFDDNLILKECTKFDQDGNIMCL